MKLRIRLRTFMLCIAVIAMPCGWYAAHAYQRQRELAAIERMQKTGLKLKCDTIFSKTPYFVLSQPNIHVFILDETPGFLRPIVKAFALKTFHRVTSISLDGEFDPNALDTLESFSQLRSIDFTYRPLQEGAAVPKEVEECIERLKKFAAGHPETSIQLPGGENWLGGAIIQTKDF